MAIQAQDLVLELVLVLVLATVDLGPMKEEIPAVLSLLKGVLVADTVPANVLSLVL